jgi:hypothetical protein
MAGQPAVWQAGLGQGHNQKKDTYTLQESLKINRLDFTMAWTCSLFVVDVAFLSW